MLVIDTQMHACFVPRVVHIVCELIIIICDHCTFILTVAIKKCSRLFGFFCRTEDTKASEQMRRTAIGSLYGPVGWHLADIHLLRAERERGENAGLYPAFVILIMNRFIPLQRKSFK